MAVRAASRRGLPRLATAGVRRREKTPRAYPECQHFDSRPAVCCTSIKLETGQLENAMRKATELMVQYAAYHRDRRNITTHFVGIPLIVFAVGVLLGRPSVAVGGLQLTPAWVLWAVSVLWYLTRGHLVLGDLAHPLI